jgi:ATP-dependent helicase YprA (DUF1998 family)
LNTFQLHRSIVDDYAEYIRSFIDIEDDDIRIEVEQALESGKLWPEPLVHFNPAYEKSGSVNEAVASGLLAAPLEQALKGYSHQIEAITLGTSGQDFIVTSGTGSGKSLTYIATVFDYLFMHGSGQGIKAIFVYPMNALINSQEQELAGCARNYEEAAGELFPLRFACRN